jgi:triosephosphate isomerase (TIM)
MAIIAPPKLRGITMRQAFVAANWKMNGTKSSVAELLEGLKANVNNAKAEVVVFAPAIFLEQVGKALEGSEIKFGAQNIITAESGAFTGETSLPMIKEFGCSHVLVGHSERRTMYAETDQLVAEKTAAALAAGVTPVVCIGESLEERESGVTLKVCAAQLQAVIDVIGIAALADTVIAYEPIWAIGTGVTATSEQAQDTHDEIRKFLAEQDANVAQKVQILYGGSMKGANAGELIGQNDIDGGLVGGASLIATEFAAIISAAE